LAIAAFNGHAGGLLALQAAARKIMDGTYDGCVVAGVDSYLAPETLEWLEAQEQLHGAGRLNNAWGFVPGEAAAAVLLLSVEASARIGAPNLGSLMAVGTATEECRIKTETVCVGQGLTSAFRQALQALPVSAQVTDVYCDMNGEPYRADEFGFACLRTKEYFVSASDFVASADCWGDVSAASAPLGIAQAAIGAASGFANGPYALVWASSENGERGAALLHVPMTPRG
jgi:3-oxoacyl-[acyl-carrier-protein] synthase-1